MKRILAALLLAALPAAAQKAEPFRAGDVVAYVGDSITHGGSYHSIVTLYYATRFPDKPIQFYNEGISGDRSSAIMSDTKYRLNVDILGHKPTVATIMLGMNDVGRADYEPGKTGPAIEAARAKSLSTYRETMGQLMDSLKASGARMIFITPSIYEESDKITLPGKVLPPAVGVNRALGECANYVREFAPKYNAGVADFWGTMNRVDDEQKKLDPMFTIVGPDRIHPGPVGHFVMAYALLDAQQVPREVATISVNARKKAADHAANCAIDKVTRVRTTVEFDAKENALPLVVPEAARPALKMVPFEDKFNQEILRVTKLKAGTYSLKIDGETIGDYSAADLAKGVNLAGIAATPMYKQSEEVTRINTERTAIGARIRDVVAMKYGLSRGKFDVSDQAALVKRLEAQVAAGKPGDAATRRAETALAEARNPGAMERQSEERLAAMYRAAQPKPHHFTLTLVKK